MTHSAIVHLEPGQEFVTVEHGSYKLAQPVAKAGLYEVQYAESDQFAAPVRQIDDAAVPCPTCLGRKTQQVSVQTRGKEGIEVYEIKCVVCEGTGVVSEETAAAVRGWWELFCRCGNPSGQTTFVADEASAECGKHHWRCVDCGKIVQIG